MFSFKAAAALSWELLIIVWSDQEPLFCMLRLPLCAVRMAGRHDFKSSMRCGLASGFEAASCLVVIEAQSFWTPVPSCVWRVQRGKGCTQGEWDILANVYRFWVEEALFKTKRFSALACQLKQISNVVLCFFFVRNYPTSPYPVLTRNHLTQMRAAPAAS